ncbi:MAG: DNA polymerase III subunit alpha [Candidatus Izemoplasmatales bacterium]
MMVHFDLFLQSAYSFNGSLLDIEATVREAKEIGYQALGLCDSEHLYGALKFYEACQKEDIRPILGLYTRIQLPGEKDLPVLLWAKNNLGFQRLIHFSSKLSCEKHVLSLEDFDGKEENLVVVLLVHAGAFQEAFLSENVEHATSLFEQLKRHFHELYFGLDFSSRMIRDRIAPLIPSVGPSVIAHQVRYLYGSDREASNMLQSILKEQFRFEDGLFLDDEDTYELKSLEELNLLYADYPDAIQRTEALIASCDVRFELHQMKLPKFPVPQEARASDYLAALAAKGLEKRLRMKAKLHSSRQTYQDRLAYELQIIHKMGYDDYFLIVWDFVLFAKKRGILVGPGRGSAAGSLVAYVLGIVDIDPLDYDLYFERFLNPERITMPDIDMDFPDDRRDEVIRYVTEKYGKDHVVSIITFGTFQGKSALRDVARMLGVSEAVTSEITSYVAETDNSIDAFEESHPDQYEHLMQNPQIKQVFDLAKRLVNLPRHVSTHAAGIIISDQPITEITAIQPGLLDMYQTQFEASDLEKLGLLKIDFLGLRNLTTIQRILERIQSTTGEVLDIYKIPLDDPATYALFQRVDTLGVFQLESTGMMNLLRQMQLKNFEDISTCIALFRPGPMENIPEFLARRSGQKRVTYLDEDLRPILASTEGIIVYQEQIMKIANVYAGYSLGEADVLRRAVSKKKESVLLEERTRFVEKCRQRGRSEAVANAIYDDIVKFANYGFNKSHSVVYSLVAYWMAWLKANRAESFLSVLLDSAIGSSVATSDYIRECRKSGIKILPPSINTSGKEYRAVKEGLAFPFLGIKGIGGVVADRLETMRQAGPYLSFVDYMRRAEEINSRVIESIIKVGMYDEIGETKRTKDEN